MDSTSYKTEWWNGREVMPGPSMRFVQHTNTPKPMKDEGLGGNIGPLFGRDQSGKLVKPKPYRPTPEDYTIGSYVTGGDKAELGKLLDRGAKLGRKRGRRSS